MQDIKKSLGKRIRELRKARHLTQERLAELVEIGPANISYIETGRFAPSGETLVKLAQALGVHIYELYMFEHYNKSISDIKSELINALNNDDKLVSMMYKFYLAVK